MGSDLPFTLGRLNCCCTNPTSCNRGGMEELCSPGVSGVTEEGRARRHTQVDTVQRFKLPKPVLCAGGLLRVELLGRAQRQDADLWLINTCTVKNPSQEHMQTDIGRGQALGKPVVVAGCVSQGDPELKFLTGLSIVGVQQLERVVEVVQETLKGGALSGKQPPGGFVQCALQHAPARARAIASSGQPPRLRRLVRAGDAGNAGNA